MKVNSKKTQLLMVSPPNGYENEAFIDLQGGKIETTTKLKLLGFVFGTTPDASEHVKEIGRKFRGRFWSLIHLRRAGFRGHELMKLFNVFVRPVIEFCSVIYHPMLTQTQSNELERFQKQAAKLAYGSEKSYAELCSEHGIETLKERRAKQVDKFVTKTMKNPRYADEWYPLREDDMHNIRDRKKYRETKTKTLRYYNSPISYYRRRANELG